MFLVSALQIGRIRRFSGHADNFCGGQSASRAYSLSSRQFRNRAWLVLETFSVSHGKASAYFPVIELLRNYFKITSDDNERTRREK